MFGEYRYPFHSEANGITVEVTETDGLYRYHRNCKGSEVTSYLHSGSGKILIHPVEPVNLPKYVTQYLKIATPAIYVEPESRYACYLTFPIEIGVFLESKGDVEIIDIFSIHPQKYSLYGTPTDGKVVRYHESTIYREIPDVDPLYEGVLSLTIINEGKDIVKITGAVFDSYLMKIFYSDLRASMVARMHVLSKGGAETEFIDVPIVGGMKNSRELYTVRNIKHVVSRVFSMDWGLEDE